MQWKIAPVEVKKDAVTQLLSMPFESGPQQQRKGGSHYSLDGLRPGTTRSQLHVQYFL